MPFMVKNISLLVFVLMPIQSVFSDEKIPEQIRRQAILIEDKLKEATVNHSYASTEYFSDLDRLGSAIDAVPGLALALKDKNREMRDEDALMELAERFHHPGERSKVDELEAWYGRLAEEVSQRTVAEYVKKYRKEAPDLPVKGIHLTTRGGQRPLSVLPEHVGGGFITAWEVWMMAPPSTERSRMDSEIGSGLYKYSERDRIALLQLHGEIKLAGKKDIPGRTQLALNIIDGLDTMPGDLAIDAILERCHRAAAGGYSGEKYHSAERHAVRAFSSWSWMADQMMDPEENTRFEKPYPQAPEEVPRVSDHWKIYKPLIEARLKNGANLSKDDRAILEEAMKLMPKE